VKILVTLISPLIVSLLADCSQPSAAKPGATPNPFAYIQNKGSDTIVNLAQTWAERYQQDHAQVNLSVAGGRSGIGITSFLKGKWVVSPEVKQIVTDLGFFPIVKK
jgi:phosphate transport system substrate-binding protein